MLALAKNMLSHDSHHRRSRPLLLLALLAGFVHHAQALSQTYCSNQNTGSDYSAVTDIYQSNGACHDTCAGSYAFAVVQWQQCWCTNYAPADQVDVSQCSQNCPGFPSEQCGDADQGLFGYIQLDIQPSGTQGSGSGGSSASSTAQSSSDPPPSSDSASPSTQDDSTVISSVPVTVTETAQQSVSVAVSYVTVSTSAQQSSTSSTPSPTSSSSSTPPPPSSSDLSTITSSTAAAVAAAVTSSTDSESLSHTTFVSTRVVTLAGAPVTQTVTSTAVVTPGAANSSTKETENKGISGGTVAGAVVGSIAGVALVLAGAFLLWRRRRADPSDPESPGSSRARKMERNTSVLSKTGLLSSPMNHADGEKFQDGAMAFGHRRNTSGSTGPNPSSPGDLDRRNSRPLIYDQRLNPAAIMEHWESNGSRASIGTMQDQRDYSRPLGVTNPDPDRDD